LFEEKMAQEKFSEGPWAVCIDAPNPLWHAGTTIFSQTEGKRVADVCVLNSEYKGNARILAAAPEMLAALQMIIRASDDDFELAHIAVDNIERALGVARAVVAKATGETLTESGRAN
jgi:hypothetical protein